MKKLIALTVAIWAASLRAEDLKIGSEIYKDYSVLKVEPDGIKISHKDGVTKIRLEQLPADLVAKYKLDPEKAREHREKKEAEQKKQEAAKAAADKAAAEKAMTEKPAARPAAPAPVVPAANAKAAADDPLGWEEIPADPLKAEKGKLWGIAEVQENMFALDGRIIRVEVIVNAASQIEAIDKDSARMFAGTIFKENSNYEFIGFPNDARDKMRVMLKGARGKMSFWVRVEAENRWPYPQLWVVGRSIHEGGLGNPPRFLW